jgi:K+-transporting ATPase ATPase A chain
MSYLTQMMALTVQNFLSAAAGIAVALALIRGIARRRADTVGNFWVDMVRSTLYVLLPISIVMAIFLVWQGLPQNLNDYTAVKGLDNFSQTIAQGPVASQLAIKQLGTNGGGFFNANSAHPFENPTALSNFVETLGILSISAGLTYTFGRMVNNTKQGWALFAAMMVIVLVGVVACYWAESESNPALRGLGIDQSLGNLEGKEVRFGVPLSGLWAVVTTAASNGSVNSMHDSFNALGGMIPMANIQLGEVVFGGVAVASTECSSSRSWQSSWPASWSVARRSTSARRCRASRYGWWWWRYSFSRCSSWY